MRHNDARKWLHAALDLLPVLLIPIFMIYSHRHSMTEQTTVDITYKYETNEVNNVSDLVVGNIYHADHLIIESGYDLICEFYIYQFGEYSIEDLNRYSIYSIFLNSYNSNDYNYFKCEVNDNELYLTTTNNNVNTTIYKTFGSITLNDVDFSFTNYNNLIEYFNNAYDFVDFGITKSDFNIIESVDVQDTNSSVMNVFMDNFNTAIDKYFNMGNVFNLNGVYQWFNTNIFGGNAPTIIYSVWNIALYELVMDLLFLLYGLFMWFIDMCKRLMEKPFDSIK